MPFVLCGLSAKSQELQGFLSRHPIQDLESEKFGLIEGELRSIGCGFFSKAQESQVRRILHG